MAHADVSREPPADRSGFGLSQAGLSGPFPRWLPRRRSSTTLGVVLLSAKLATLTPCLGRDTVEVNQLCFK